MPRAMPKHEEVKDFMSVSGDVSIRRRMFLKIPANAIESQLCYAKVSLGSGDKMTLCSCLDFDFARFVQPCHKSRTKISMQIFSS